MKMDDLTINPMVIKPPGASAPGSAGAVSDAPPAGKGFGEFLAESIQKVSEIQQDADRRAAELVAGKPVSVHETMIAVEEASLSFKLMMQIRNKVVQAYEEVMRTQI
ncbi:MAG: flagellar hook-basal body complex protein FliE [Nitrospirae bacterium]|nr:flagellar hook-basal body complex protein FliE [Nitrospirota bacterium]